MGKNQNGILPILGEAFALYPYNWLKDMHLDSTRGLGLFANILTCGCCIPIHESLSNLLLRRSSTSETNNFRNSRNGRLSTKRREHFEVESTSLTSQQCRYNQGHVSEEHLELIEKDSKKAVGGGQGKM